MSEILSVGTMTVRFDGYDDLERRPHQNVDIQYYYIRKEEVTMTLNDSNVDTKRSGKNLKILTFYDYRY